MGIVLVDRDAEELLSEMFVFVVCVFCISIGFSGVSRDSVIVTVIVGVGEVCFDIFRRVSDIVVVSFDIVDTGYVGVRSANVDVVGDSFDIFRGVSDIVVVSFDIVDTGDLDIVDGSFDIFRGVSEIVVISFDVGDVCLCIFIGVSDIIVFSIDVEVGIAVLDWFISTVFLVIVLVPLLVNKFVKSKTINFH